MQLILFIFCYALILVYCQRKIEDVETNIQVTHNVLENRLERFKRHIIAVVNNIIASNNNNI